jgi:hypothetical protein
MVKTAISSHAKINRDKLVTALAIFGKKTLVLRVVTRTVDAFGQLSATTTADTTFTGDLQFGLDLDQRYLSSGLVEVGEGVLYLHPTELSTLPLPQNQVIDGNSVWEILDQIESPELNGTVTFYTYRCRRRINVSDT